MLTGAPQRLALGEPEPLGHGLLNSVNVVSPNDKELLGGFEYETDACALAEVYEQLCLAIGVDPATKSFDDAPEWVTSCPPFATYAGVDCDMQVTSEAEQRAVRRLGYGEHRQVDAKFVECVEADADLVDLGGPYPMGKALGMLEEVAASVYGGLAMIVAPRSVVTCACQCQLVNPGLDGRLSTCLGSRVIPITPPTIGADPATVYVTGRITIIQGPVRSYSVPSFQDESGRCSPPRALAERLNVMAYECIAAKVQVTCE